MAAVRKMQVPVGVLLVCKVCCTDNLPNLERKNSGRMLEESGRIPETIQEGDNENHVDDEWLEARKQADPRDITVEISSPKNTSVEITTPQHKYFDVSSDMDSQDNSVAKALAVSPGHPATGSSSSSPRRRNSSQRRIHFKVGDLVQLPKFKNVSAKVISLPTPTIQEYVCEVVATKRNLLKTGLKLPDAVRFNPHVTSVDENGKPYLIAHFRIKAKDMTKNIEPLKDQDLVLLARHANLIGKIIEVPEDCTIGYLVEVVGEKTFLPRVGLDLTDAERFNPLSTDDEMWHVETSGEVGSQNIIAHFRIFPQDLVKSQEQEIIDLANAFTVNGELNGSDGEGGTLLHNHVVLTEKAHLIGTMINKCKLNPNQKNDEGLPPLLVAVYNGFDNGVEALLKHGADVHFQHEDTLSAVEIAESMGHTNIARLLRMQIGDLSREEKIRDLADRYMQGNISGNNVNGGSLLLVNEVLKDKPYLIEKLVNKYKLNPNIMPPGHKWTPLHFACTNGYTEAAEALLRNGANPNASDKDKRVDTPLNIAQSRGHLKIVDMIKNHMLGNLPAQLPKTRLVERLNLDASLSFAGDRQF